jgi:Uma2 family endonuclease
VTKINPPMLVTPEDLLRLEGGDSLYELVDGLLFEKNISSLVGEATVIITARLYSYVELHHLGVLYSQSTYQCFPRKPKQVRRPDISFILSSRLSEVPVEGHIPVRPDLAIEVVSAGDDVYDLDEKLQDYKSAGIPLTWVFNPEQRLVRIYEAGRLKGELEDHEELRGEPVLPGFGLLVSELFPARKI